MDSVAAEDFGPGAEVAGLFQQAYQLGPMRCVVQCEDPHASGLLDRFLAHLRVASDMSRVQRTYLVSLDEAGLAWLRVDGEVRVGGRTLREALDHLVWDFSREAIDFIEGRLAVHAGAVSWAGAGVVLPAPSGSGKSTLTAGLTAAGCGYLSDEAAVVDLSSGTLEPFPRPLWLSAESVELIPGLSGRLPEEERRPPDGKRVVPPGALRAEPLGGPVPLRAVIVPELDPGAATVLEPIRRSEAVLALMTNAFNMADFKAAGVRALAGIAPRLDAYRLRVGDLPAAVDLVMAALGELAGPGGQAAGGESPGP